MPHASVDAYIESVPHWREELTQLIAFCRETDMEEAIKWNMPCYGFGKNNLVAVGGFKHHFCLWFHQGADLSDPSGILINVQKGKTQKMRQMRMEGAADIRPDVIRQLLEETITRHG